MCWERRSPSVHSLWTGHPKTWELTEEQRQEDHFVPVEIVEERQQVECQFAPALFLTEGQNVSIHDGCWVVESWTAHHRSAHIPATGQRKLKPIYFAHQVHFLLCVNMKRGVHLCVTPTSRHDKPAAVSWGRGWATRPHRRTSRRRRSGWDTLAAPAGKSKSWKKMSQFTKEQHWVADYCQHKIPNCVSPAVNVVRCEDLKGKLRSSRASGAFSKREGWAILRARLPKVTLQLHRVKDRREIQMSHSETLVLTLYQHFCEVEPLVSHY